MGIKRADKPQQSTCHFCCLTSWATSSSMGFAALLLHWTRCCSGLACCHLHCSPSKCNCNSPKFSLVLGILGDASPLNQIFKSSINKQCFTLLDLSINLAWGNTLYTKWKNKPNALTLPGCNRMRSLQLDMLWNGEWVQPEKRKSELWDLCFSCSIPINGW